VGRRNAGRRLRQPVIPGCAEQPADAASARGAHRRTSAGVAAVTTVAEKRRRVAAVGVPASAAEPAVTVDQPTAAAVTSMTAKVGADPARPCCRRTRRSQYLKLNQNSRDTQTRKTPRRSKETGTENPNELQGYFLGKGPATSWHLAIRPTQLLGGPPQQCGGPTRQAVHSAARRHNHRISKSLANLGR
jgi:hypothetical protein